MLYEKRTYDITVGKMPEAIEYYNTLGWPALDAGGHSANLIGYFISDTGSLHQLVHMWKFEDDADRRAFWKRLFADPDFVKFAAAFRPLVKSQEVQLLTPAPWGPHP